MRLAWSEGSGAWGEWGQGVRVRVGRSPRGGRAWLRRVGALEGEGPFECPSGQGSGRTALRGAFDGVWSRGCDEIGGRRGAAPLAPLALSPTTMGECGSIAAGGVGVRVAAGRALREAPLVGGWRCDGECWWWECPSPLAPLDTGFRRYDDGDVRANKCCWWRRGESPAAAGRALREAPLRCVGGVGDATGVGGGGPFDRLRANWIPAFAGTTMGMCGPISAAGGVGVRVPLRRDGRFAKRPYDGVWGSGMRRGLVVGVPRPPSGYRLSPVRRWGCAGRQVLVVMEG